MRAADLLGDRWSLLVLREVFYGVGRFDDMRRDLDAPRGALASRLERLVGAGVLTQRPYREPGQRERREYVLTDAGRALGPSLAALMQWGDAQRGGTGPLEFRDARTGRPLHVALVDADGRAVPAEHVLTVVSATGEAV